MLDEKSDKTFVGAERRAMDADRYLIDVVAIFIAKVEPARLGEINLVGRDGKLASDHAPRLHVDLGAVEGRFVRHFDIIDSRVLQDASLHFVGLFPLLWFNDKLLH